MTVVAFSAPPRRPLSGDRSARSRHGKQLLHHNHARNTLQTAFHRDALIVRAFEQLIERVATFFMS